MRNLSIPTHVSKAHCGILAAMVMTFVSGCGMNAEPVSDPVQAETVLSTALEAWKSGTTCEDLEKRTPSIVVVDPDWKAGAGLLAFEPQPARVAGNNVTMPVRLTLKTSKGRKVERTAVYAITTSPVALIIREDG